VRPPARDQLGKIFREPPYTTRMGIELNEAIRALEGLTDDPYAGGPYVMWKDTPYAHIMIPLAEERPPRP